MRNESSKNQISEIQNAKVSILRPQGWLGRLTLRIWYRSELKRQSYGDFTAKGRNNWERKPRKRRKGDGTYLMSQQSLSIHLCARES